MVRRYVWILDVVKGSAKDEEADIQPSSLDVAYTTSMKGLHEASGDTITAPTGQRRLPLRDDHVGRQGLHQWTASCSLTRSNGAASIAGNLAHLHAKEVLPSPCFLKVAPALRRPPVIRHTPYFVLHGVPQKIMGSFWVPACTNHSTSVTPNSLGDKLDPNFGHATTHMRGTSVFDQWSGVRQ